MRVGCTFTASWFLSACLLLLSLLYLGWPGLRAGGEWVRKCQVGRGQSESKKKKKKCGLQQIPVTEVTFGRFFSSTETSSTFPDSFVRTGASLHCSDPLELLCYVMIRERWSHIYIYIYNVSTPKNSTAIRLLTLG